MAVDFQKEFDDFFAGGSHTSAVKEVYNIIPTLSQEQQKIVALLEFYIHKWRLNDLRIFLDTILRNQERNKNLNFFQNQLTKQLLKTYSMEEMVRGIKPTVTHQEEQKS